MAFRDDLKIQVQQATNIVDLIGEQLLLKHKGREFVGLCPFHEDRNPSMYVSPAKQIFHCFVCGAGGDALGWQMKYHKMTFPEALRYLAERAGIKVEETGDRGQGTGASERQVIAEANGLAVMFFQKLFRHPQQGATARAYIDKRNIPKELIETFQIGYAPDGWDGMVKAVATNKWNQRGFELAGLISPRDKGPRDQGLGPRETRSEDAAAANQTTTSNSQASSLGPRPSSLGPSSFYDRLRHRIIFPICDGLGRPIAFGGRKIRDEDEPKYLNSPETALFNKSRTLYGLHLAKKAIIDSRTAIIVEGYIDVIACHAMGSANVVATLGTALTGEHVRELRKYCDKVVLTFDADAAGQRAADRALEIFLGEEVDVAIAAVPEGKDPGDLMNLPDGATRWKQAIEEAIDALDYQFARVKEQMDAAQTMTARQRIAEDYLRRIAVLDLRKTGPIRKAMVMQRLAQMLHMSEEAVNTLLKKFAPVRNQRQEQEQRQPQERPGNLSAFTPATAPAAAAASAPATDFSPFSQDVVTDNGDNANTTQTEKSQHLVYLDVASVVDSAKMSESVNIALVRAERQFMGCLLREPGLFHLTLSDGRPVDEAIMPGEMVTASGQQLYEVMYHHLAEGTELTLSMLLAELAERGEPKLAELATVIEKEVDDMTAASSVTNRSLADKLAAAASRITEFRRKQEQRNNPAALPLSEPTDNDEALRKAMALRNTQRSSLSIMRTKRD